MGIESHRQILQGHVAPHKVRERKGPSRGVIQKCELHERNACGPTFEDRTQVETLHQEKCTRRVALAKSVYRHRNSDKATFYSPTEIKAAPAHTSKSPEERDFVVDSGASMHMPSKKDLSSEELETLRRSRNPTTVVMANGEVQTNDEAQVYVHHLSSLRDGANTQRRLEFHHLENSAKNTGTPASGSVVKNRG